MITNKKILFIAPLPTADRLADGMIQRIAAVDSEFQDFERVYLEISFSKNIHFKEQKISEKSTYIQVNLFIHLLKIVQLIREINFLYIHSLFSFQHLIILRHLLKGKTITLDVHGSVPEESEFSGKRKLALYQQWVESRLFPLVTNFVFVSHEMQKFYAQKYPYTQTKQCLVKPIFSKNVMNDLKPGSGELANRLKIKDTDTVLIYAGNLQAWQNVDLMISTINKMDNSKYYFIILTGEVERVKQIFENQIWYLKRRIHIDKVSPNELRHYYQIAHYGFILRDEHILNQVAAPTKMIEYLYFGITPIVKYERIGDCKSMGYEYIHYLDPNINHLSPMKSMKNENIAKEILKSSCSVDLKELINS